MLFSKHLQVAPELAKFKERKTKVTFIISLVPLAERWLRNMRIKQKKMIKKVMVQGVLTSFLLLYAGLLHTESRVLEPPRIELGIENFTGELPDANGAENQPVPLVDLEEEKPLYN